MQIFLNSSSSCNFFSYNQAVYFETLGNFCHCRMFVKTFRIDTHLVSVCHHIVNPTEQRSSRSTNVTGAFTRPKCMLLNSNIPIVIENAVKCLDSGVIEVVASSSGVIE